MIREWGGPPEGGAARCRRTHGSARETRYLRASHRLRPELRNDGEVVRGQSPSGRIYKAARPDVTVDLIFRAGERIELDERISRGRRRRSRRSRDYLAERGSVHAPTRLLSLLLYALDAGIVVPPPTLEHLASVTLDPSRASSRPSGLA